MKGFTLIETMVAVTILTLAIAGPLYSASRAILAAQIARDQLVASYLAQEGIEYVRVMRDDAFLAAYHSGDPNVSRAAWDEFRTGTGPASIAQCRGPALCTLDPARSMGTRDERSLEPCSGACAPLRMVNGAYTGRSDVPEDEVASAAFTRTLQTVASSESDERITSTVSWNFHGSPYSVTVGAHLTSWQ